MIEFFREVWADNRHTIGGKKPASNRMIFALYFFEFLVALGLTMMTPTPSPDFLAGSLSAFAILAGFSFSSLLFFVDHDFSVIVDKDSREQSTLQKNITALSNQLFANIHYFNLCCLLVICGCLIGLSAPIAARVFGDLERNSMIPFLAESIGRWVLYVIALEALVGFVRILRRIRYLFDKVREAHQKRMSAG